MTAEKLLLTAEEAANVLSIGRTKVYELIALGELESVTVGRSRRVPVASLARFVERLHHDEHIDQQGSGRMSRRRSRTRR